VQTCIRLGREDSGGEIRGPENHSGCVKVDTPGGEDAIDVGPIEREVAGRLWNAPTEDKSAASRLSHVVEASNGVLVGKMWRQLRIMKREFIQTSAGSNIQSRAGGRKFERKKYR
jgi:hypothetical protein